MQCCYAVQIVTVEARRQTTSSVKNLGDGSALINCASGIGLSKLGGIKAVYPAKQPSRNSSHQTSCKGSEHCKPVGELPCKLDCIYM